MSPLRDRANGRWLSILPLLGIGHEFLTGRQTACPICRAGKDRFRFDNKEGRGTWICNRCGAGDGFDLVMRVHGWDFHTTATRIEELLPSAPVTPIRRERSPEEVRKALNDLWRSSAPVVQGDPVWRWLNNRVGGVEVPPTIRCCHEAVFTSKPLQKFPAMVAMVMDADGKPVTLHRTFLTKDGEKAPVAGCRKFMPGEIPAGSAVRLMPHEKVLGIAEGIETAFAAAKLFNMPVWAALNATMLSKWIAPREVELVVIFGDNDTSFTGQEAAYALAKKLTNEGFGVEVEIPKIAGHDWNNVLNDERCAA